MRWIVLALWLVFVAPAAARDIFVDNVKGDDISRGDATDFSGEGSGPIRTINKALRICRPGDRIVLAKNDEPYHEMLSLSAGKHWGFRNAPTTIVGNGATLDGTAPVPGNAWEHEQRGIYRFQPSLLSYQQLYLDGKPADRVTFPVGNRRLLDLKPLQWALFDGSLFFRPEENLLPDHYNLRYAALQTGITLYHVRHVRIENLIVQGFQLDGINAHDGCYDVVLSGITARGNGRSGISIGGSSQVRIEDSVIGDNGRAQLRTEGFSTATVERTELIGNTAPAYVQAGGKAIVDGKRMEDGGAGTK